MKAKVSSQLVVPANERLPPMTMLRAFEAAARYGNLSRAADELNVTHGAVSRQVSELERYIGCQLFRRQAHGVALTEAGKSLFHGTTLAFDRLGASLDDVEAWRGTKTVTVTTLPSFSTYWLLPRLPRFLDLNPRIGVQIRTSTMLDDLRNPPIDFAIRYGAGRWSGTTSELLIATDAFPMCSPDFLKKHGPFTDPRQMTAVPLVHDVTRQWWVDWFMAAGVRATGLNGGIVVDDYALAVTFALDGHGVALAREPLVRGELAAGRLVSLSDIRVTPQFSYHIARATQRKTSPEAATLQRWLRAEARGER